MKQKINPFKNRIIALLLLLFLPALFAGCKKQTAEETAFREYVTSFCAEINDIDLAINSLDAETPESEAELLNYLDKLNRKFREFADYDFPPQYDHLEDLADEAGNYMDQAVLSYHALFESEEIDENTAEYARENSARAFKRVQVILDVLNGKEPKP